MDTNKGTGAGITTAMITVDDNILAGNVNWGQGDGRVYRTTNFGVEWFGADNGMTFRPYIYAFANIGNLIFAAESHAEVHRTFDFGANWTLSNSGLIGTTLSLLAKDTLIFVGLSGPGVYVSTNLGNTWMSKK